MCRELSSLQSSAKPIQGCSPHSSRQDLKVLGPFHAAVMLSIYLGVGLYASRLPLMLRCFCKSKHTSLVPCFALLKQMRWTQALQMCR